MFGVIGVIGVAGVFGIVCGCIAGTYLGRCR
jgi:hypothetical protein